MEHTRNWIAPICYAIVGMSLGGALALVSCESLPFACAVTVSTPYQAIPYPNLSFLSAAFPILGVFQYLLRSIPKPPPLDFLDKQAAKDHLTYSVFPTRGVIETARLLTQMRRVLPQITIPVLVIHSRKDKGVPINNAEELINALGSQGSESFFVENSGHVVLLEPERQHAANAIIEFILNTTRRQR